ncbi:O-antigen ligase family protein [Deinococcus ruber]|uniref:O-antigen ligase family protein n=1 Tax=Deinococcus ruber TaxID=1848197 RepID=UPI001665D06D|nr:O-antigen ligase family protein [Deinococcus ruber]
MGDENLRVLNIVMYLFAALTIFFIFPQKNFVSTLYLPRLYILYLFALFVSITLFSFSSKGLSLYEYFRHKKTTFLLLICISYIVWINIADSMSFLPGYAFTGSEYLSFGGLALSSCLVVMLIYSKFIYINKIISLFSFSTLIVLIISFIEALGFHPLSHWINNSGLTYPAVTIGLRQHLAGWFAMMSLAPLYFWRNKPTDPRFWIWMCSGLLGVALCKNSGATVGVVIGLFGWLIVSKGMKNLKSWITTLFFLLAVFTIPPAVKYIGTAMGLQSYDTKSYTSTNTFSTRLLLWRSALRAGVEHPIFGWGDETFGWQVFEHLTEVEAQDLIRREAGVPSENRIVHSEGIFYSFPKNGKGKGKNGVVLFVRPHNFIFDELYSHGFVGLLILLAFIVVLVRAFPNTDRAMFIIGFLPYPLSLLTLFYVPTITPTFFILLGLALASSKISLTRVSTNSVD